MFRRKHADKNSEEKILQQARNRLAHVERWGRWYLAFCWMLFAVLLGIAVAVGFLFNAVVRGPLANGPREFVFGFILGAFAMGAFWKMFIHLQDTWSSTLPDPRDRLLVQYHDALKEIVAKREETNTGAEPIWPTSHWRGTHDAGQKRSGFRRQHR